MKNTKLRKERGITLVALVITIVVLLILAAVAIVSLSGNNNIITKAQEAKGNYKEAGENEEVKLNEYSNELEKWFKEEDGDDEIIGTYTLGDEVLTFGEGGAFSMLASDAHDAGYGSYTVDGNNITVSIESLYMHDEWTGYLYGVTSYFTFAKENGVATVTQTRQTCFYDSEKTNPGSDDFDGLVYTRN